MVVDPKRAIGTIDILINKIDKISQKEYDDNRTVKEFAEIVFDVIRFVRLSVKGIKERSWYREYYEFTCWSKDGVTVGRMLEDETKQKDKKWTVGKAYEYNIEGFEKPIIETSLCS